MRRSPRRIEGMRPPTPFREPRRCHETRTRGHAYVPLRVRCKTRHPSSRSRVLIPSATATQGSPGTGASPASTISEVDAPRVSSRQASAEPRWPLARRGPTLSPRPAEPIQSRRAPPTATSDRASCPRTLRWAVPASPAARPSRGRAVWQSSGRVRSKTIRHRCEKRARSSAAPSSISHWVTF